MTIQQSVEQLIPSERALAVCGINRSEMRLHQAPFLECVSFLQKTARQRSFNMHFEAYKLKHVVECRARQLGMDLYVPVECLIAAAIMCGFKTKQMEGLTYFDIRLDNGPTGEGVWCGKYMLWDGQ